MEFINNTGHIFSLPSFNEKPIGYEYEEYSYVFWIDTKNSRLSVNNYYSKPIYALYQLQSDIVFNNGQIKNIDDTIEIEIYFKDTNVFSLISSKKMNEYILSNKYNDLTDYIDLDNLNDKNTFVKKKLTNEDLLVYKTTERIEKTENGQTRSSELDYLVIPIYPVAMASEEGAWISNLMIHIYDKKLQLHEWCYVSVGGEFVNTYEELIINGRNMGVSLPKDIIKAIYSESIYNNEFNESLYNVKLKEYMINYMSLRGERGNFNSAINALKWFGYGDKLTISKLLKTDNNFIAQYINDYFDISTDVIYAFKKFTTDTLISLRILLNRETDELYKFNFDESFYGENKPKMISLLDTYEKVKIGNHDMPIEDDPEKYWYWKPYFDFSFNELGVKLMLLCQFYKKYFLPLHLTIHSASLGYKVFANDIKLSNNISYNITLPSIMINSNCNEVEFLGKGIHNFTKQIHYIDNNFNEFELPNINIDKRDWFELNDTCVNIPIKFKNNKYYNCVLLLQKKSNNTVLFESHFSFIQNDKKDSEYYTYKNFIIYPKKLNRYITKIDDKIDIRSNFYEYWINEDFIIKLLVNNTWYSYEFRLEIHNPTIDFGTLRYRYYLNEHNYLANRIITETENNANISNYHALIFASKNDVSKIKQHNVGNIKNYLNKDNTPELTDFLYNKFDLINNNDAENTFIKILDANDPNIYQYLESNYNNLSPFTQLKTLNDNSVAFNAYMHNAQLVHVNNIDFDIDFYKILKYHLDRNLMYIDGTLIDNEFYQYIIYENGGNKYEIIIQKDLIGTDLEIPEDKLHMYSNILICAYENITYILTETGDHDNSYYITDIYDMNNAIVLAEYEEDEIPVALVYDSLSFKYDIETNEYYREYTNADGTSGIIRYPIYDKLYSNSERIHSKYFTSLNLPNISKYKNSIHLFNIYTTETVEDNILIFHNNIDVYVNGLRFTHNTYNMNDNNSLKFYVNGKIGYGEESNSKYIDVYGLHLINNPEIIIDENTNHILLKDVPIEYIDKFNQYGIYIKRDYEKYYDTQEVDKIYELENIEDFDTKEFTYYEENTLKDIGYNIYNTIDDFYINKYESIHTIYPIFIEDDSYWFTDEEVKDLDDATKTINNLLTYRLEFYTSDNSLIDNVTLNTINNIEYSYIKANFSYHPKHIVRNRFYLLSDVIKMFDDKITNINFDNETITINGNEYNIVKVNNKYTYVDTSYDHIILNQNPSMYWFNFDNNDIESLPNYLNELERFVYDNNKMTQDEIFERLDKYKNKNFNDDRNLALYRYLNYLSKDLTGYEGTYRLEIYSENMNEYKIRLYVEILNDDKIETYTSDDNNTFTLTGDEQNVMLYIQIYKPNESIDYELNGCFIPKLIKIYSKEFPLKYESSKSGNEMTVMFLNKEYKYGDNTGSFVCNLYNDFFELKFNIYDALIISKDNENSLIPEYSITPRLLNSVYDCVDDIKLKDTYLDYDFYLMHDDEYWYCLYISKQTIDKIHKQSDLKISSINKTIKFDGKSNTNYVLKHSRSSEEYLINRLEFISSNGFNQFNKDDIICCYVHNNDRLPFNPYISSKWALKSMSIGSNIDSKFDSNGEMTILSIPTQGNNYVPGYYKVDVKYSLDRDVQHQFKNTSTFKIL